MKRKDYVVHKTHIL
eukprot:UN08069